MLVEDDLILSVSTCKYQHVIDLFTRALEIPEQLALDTETGAAQGNFLWHLAESAANQIQVGLVGLATTGLEFGG